MPPVRCTAFFHDDDGHGWSEAHDIDGGTGTPALTTIMANFNNLIASWRVPLLGGDAFYDGCRVSYPTPSGVIAGDNIRNDPPIRGPLTALGTTVNMGPPEAAIKLRFRNAASTARTDVYIRGQWHQLVTAGVLDFTSALGAEWKDRSNNYANALIQGGYGWVGIDPAATSRGKVTDYTQNADDTVTLSLTATNAVPLPAVGTKMSFKFARINNSKSILNRAIVCEVDAGGATVSTIKQVATSPFVSKGTYIAPVRALIPYAAMSYAILAKRKTGRPFFAGRGRLSAATLH